MKKNKKSRIMTRVLTYLYWANAYRACNENEYAYKEVLAAKRCLEECGCENVKVAFSEGEYHLHFEIDHARQKRNRCYTVSVGHGYVNRYHVTNWTNINRLIERLEFEYSCTLRRDYRDYQFFLHVADDVLYWGLEGYEYRDYYHNGKIEDIPFDVAVNLCRKLRGCLGEIANEAVAHKKVVI